MQNACHTYRAHRRMCLFFTDADIRTDGQTYTQVLLIADRCRAKCSGAVTLQAVAGVPEQVLTHIASCTL